MLETVGDCCLLVNSVDSIGIAKWRHPSPLSLTGCNSAIKGTSLISCLVALRCSSETSARLAHPNAPAASSATLSPLVSSNSFPISRMKATTLSAHRIAEVQGNSACNAPDTQALRRCALLSFSLLFGGGPPGQSPEQQHRDAEQGWLFITCQHHRFPAGLGGAVRKQMSPACTHAPPGASDGNRPSALQGGPLGAPFHPSRRARQAKWMGHRPSGPGQSRLSQGRALGGRKGDMVLRQLLRLKPPSFLGKLLLGHIYSPVASGGQ